MADIRGDRTLRHVEMDVLIPKKMREKGQVLCSEHVNAFSECCKSSSVFMVFKCRKENTALKTCLTSYYRDPEFYDMCKREYLQEKEDFQIRGIPLKLRKQQQAAAAAAAGGNQEAGH
ncbi:COX assembly mitochondrial protein homolog [Petromyzon marinus]|uniref:COX assembly mitochondrial protein n=1 Tax=Petromyzon marinus TaxID=7757 RepID=A0AAJ7U7T0_PETMA|nr:COX assembly mitochondrial protein homolog [Petromyzon marinus]